MWVNIGWMPVSPNKPTKKKKLDEVSGFGCPGQRSSLASSGGGERVDKSDVTTWYFVFLLLKVSIYISNFNVKVWRTYRYICSTLWLDTCSTGREEDWHPISGQSRKERIFLGETWARGGFQCVDGCASQTSGDDEAAPISSHHNLRPKTHILRSQMTGASAVGERHCGALIVMFVIC